MAKQLFDGNGRPTIVNHYHERKYYKPTFAKLGYIGIGKYKQTKDSYLFKLWYDILRQVNKGRFSIEPRLLNFQYFAKWYEDNKPDDTIHYVLDITLCQWYEYLNGLNMIYSTRTMAIIPSGLKSFLMKLKRNPIGSRKVGNGLYIQNHINHCEDSSRIFNKRHGTIVYKALDVENAFIWYNHFTYRVDNHLPIGNIQYSYLLNAVIPIGKSSYQIHMERKEKSKDSCFGFR